MNTVKGIDVSYYDWLINWKEYDNDFAFIKCSEGAVIDKVFREQWRNARGRVVRGAYHFFRSFVDPILAADKLAEYLDGDVGELPPVLDLEANNGRDDAIAIALRLMRRFYEVTKRKMMVYTSPSFLLANRAHLFSELSTYRLWLATYPFDFIEKDLTQEEEKRAIERRARILKDIWEGRMMLSFPPPPAPFKRVSFFQFTGRGDPRLIKGYQSSKAEIDMNFYNGETVKDMFNEFQINYMPKPMEETMLIYARIKSLTNIRNGPYDNYYDIGDLPAGSRIVAIDKVRDVQGRYWYKLKEAYNAAGGPIITTSGKAVSEVVAWCFAGNAEEYTPDAETPTTPEPLPNKIIQSITIEGATKIIIKNSDGTTTTLP